jgi:site-specific DNA-methyltransferase (adenine-specific)
MIRIENSDFLSNDIADSSIDLVVTDPPYKIVGGGCTTISGGIFNKEQNVNVKTGTLFNNNEIAFSDWIPEVYRVLKNGTHAYIMCNGRNVANLQAEAEKAGFTFQNLLVWNKGNVTPNRYYMQKCEFILMLRKGKARTINNPGSNNLLEIPNIIGKKQHPTEKPVELMKIMIENSSNPGETILDPFIGAGSSGIAALQLGRSFIGYEIDKKYYEIASARIDEAERFWGVF